LLLSLRLRLRLRLYLWLQLRLCLRFGRRVCRLCLTLRLLLLLHHTLRLGLPLDGDL